MLKYIIKDKIKTGVIPVFLNAIKTHDLNEYSIYLATVIYFLNRQFLGLGRLR